MTARLASLLVGLVGAVALSGCAGSHISQGQITPAIGTLANPPVKPFHSPNHHYSVHQVELAFGANQLPLRNVSPKAYGGLLAFLDARPTHPVFVYVSVEACKCELKPALRNANVTRHGNVEVLWRDGEKSAVQAALRELD
jgi:hypothetical protein